MAYLTFDEFKTLTGLSNFDDTNFKKYLTKASAVLDNVTNRFYQLNKIDDDPILFRVQRFKLGLCAQIVYFNELKADTFESINKSPQTFSAGRTSVSNGTRYNSNGGNESKSLESEDIYLYLEGTGLLYRGLEP